MKRVQEGILELYTWCHILPPSEIIWGCLRLFLQTWKGNIYSTELAERVEYGKYDYTHDAVEKGYNVWLRPSAVSPRPRRPARASSASGRDFGVFVGVFGPRFYLGFRVEVLCFRVLRFSHMFEVSFGDHPLKLERYREDSHGPCARMTRTHREA